MFCFIPHLEFLICHVVHQALGPNRSILKAQKALNAAVGTGKEKGSVANDTASGIADRSLQICTTKRLITFF
jgi:hypothetical protein